MPDFPASAPNLASRRLLSRNYREFYRRRNITSRAVIDQVEKVIRHGAWLFRKLSEMRDPRKLSQRADDQGGRQVRIDFGSDAS